jgi:hypothetical protein
MSTTTIWKPCPGFTRRSAPARAITPRCACWRQVKQLDPSIFTKSGIMLGLGEDKLRSASGDGRHALAADIDFLTMGQYLQPTPKHARVIEFVHACGRSTPMRAIARAKGFLQVAASAAHALQLSCRRGFRARCAPCARGATGQACLHEKWQRITALMPGITRKPGACPTAPEQMFALVADVQSLPEVPALD